MSRRIAWTDDEDIILSNSCKIHGKKWRIIAQLLQGRSEDSVRNRAFRQKYVESSGITISKSKIRNIRKRWEVFEDNIITDFVVKYGKKWNNLADLFHNRTSHAIRNRYYRIAVNKWETHIDVDVLEECISHFM